MGEKMAADGGGMAEEMSDGMQCSDHPYRRNPSGVCAFCLQEKLGNLVSSKSSDPFSSIPPPPTSSSSPPSFDSIDLPSLPSSTSSTRKFFLSAKHRHRRMKTPAASATQTTRAPQCKIAAAAEPKSEVIILKRSKSVTPRPNAVPVLTDSSGSARKKSLWSFFTFSYSSSALIPYFGNKRRSTSSAFSSVAGGGDGADLLKSAKDDAKTPRREQAEAPTVNDEASPSGSQASSSFGRKVARSRSVGCGSRSFSGDFLERISNGFGDCTLRRVESHRESKSKVSIHRREQHHGDDDENQQIKERVKCSSIFVGLGMVSSSSYWLSAADACSESCCLQTTKRGSAPHGLSKSWGWTFASPMRAFRPGGGGSQPPL